MKIQRLDYNRLAEVLSERGLVEPATLHYILQQCFNTGELFPEVLVRENLVADWELSRLACETFHLVFLPVEGYAPSREAIELVDRAFLHQHCLLPLDIYGDMLTVAVPALTPSEVLSALGEKLGKTIQPLVGTPASNRRWLDENAPLQEENPNEVDEVTSPLPEAIDEGWSQLFDEGDAAVLMDLQEPHPQHAKGKRRAQSDADSDFADLGGPDEFEDLLS